MSHTMYHLTILQKLGEETGEAVALGGIVEAPVGYDTIALPPSSIPSLFTALLPAAHSSCGEQQTPPAASVSLGLQSKSLVALII